MHRRDFVGSFVVFVLAPVAACSGNGSTGSGGGGESCDGAGADTSTVSNHYHFVCVPKSDLDSPPTAGAMYETSEAAGHMHQVTVTQADLQSMSQGPGVTLTTSANSSH